MHDRHPLRTLSLFAGVGGLDLGVWLASAGRAEPVAYVEKEALSVGKLADAIDQGALGRAPIFPDVRWFDGRRWAGLVDCLVVGLPCQPWSSMGKRLGIEDDRFLWPHVARILRETRAPALILEEVDRFRTSGGLEVVLRDLDALGYDAEWACLRAQDVGAPHGRRRVFVLAHNQHAGFLAGCQAHMHDGRDAPWHNADRRHPSVGSAEWPVGPLDDWPQAEDQPALCGAIDGTAEWSRQLHLLGDAVCPLQAAYTISRLASRAVGVGRHHVEAASFAA